MSPIELLQRFIHGRLASDPYFADVGLYLMRPRRASNGAEISLPHIVDQIEAALSGRRLTAGKAGAAVTVEMPYVTVPNADAQTLFDVNVTVRCQESPTINMSAGGTRKSAEELGIAVIKALNGFVPHGVSGQLYCGKDAMAFNEEFLPRLAYDVTISTKMEIDEPRRVALPRITVTGPAPGAVMTIACATEGAAIYYTLNESFPSAANAAATLYSGPVMVNDAGAVFAAAYLEGRSGSNVAYAEVEAEDVPANAMRNEAGTIVYAEDGSIATSEG